MREAFLAAISIFVSEFNQLSQRNNFSSDVRDQKHDQKLYLSIKNAMRSKQERALQNSNGIEYRRSTRVVIFSSC